MMVLFSAHHMRFTREYRTKISLFQDNSAALGDAIHLAAIGAVGQDLCGLKLLRGTEMNDFLSIGGDHQVYGMKMNLKPTLCVLFQSVFLLLDLTGGGLRAAGKESGSNLRSTGNLRFIQRQT